MHELTLTHVVAGVNSHKMTMNLGSVLAQRNEKANAMAGRREY